MIHKATNISAVTYLILTLISFNIFPKFLFHTTKLNTKDTKGGVVYAANKIICHEWFILRKQHRLYIQRFSRMFRAIIHIILLAIQIYKNVLYLTKKSTFFCSSFLIIFLNKIQFMFSISSIAFVWCRLVHSPATLTTLVLPILGKFVAVFPLSH